jgi:endopeptidase La
MQNTENKMEKKVYGHKEAKETIVELLGKWLSNSSSLGKAIGLLGPPGVGKTLLAKELGNALDIPLAKINLGGMTDAAVLTGHNITYSGAVPGLIIKKMIETKKSRCILFFDELDKTNSVSGINNIYNVLIHATDQTTNSEFNDNFFQDVSFPLNKVLFVFSFNDKKKIDPILLDRMEIIEVREYSIEDKIEIVKNYLIKEFKKDFDFKFDINMSNEVIEYLINNFTNEPGVRSINKKLDKLFLKMNRDIIYETGPFHNFKSKSFDITKDIIDKYLTQVTNYSKKNINYPEVGCVNGLYATGAGTGGALPISIYSIKNTNSSKFEFQLTGQQGSVMKESVTLSYTIATNIINNEYITDFLNKNQHGLHIHIPDGSTPKDGPSAGSAFTLGFVSKILNKRIKHDIGLTGEIERRGCITAIGGLEHKLPGAKKAGLKFVFVPKENEHDIKKLKNNNPKLFDDNFKIKFVEHISEVLEYALIENDELEYSSNLVYDKLFDAAKYLNLKPHEKNIHKMPPIIESESDNDYNDQEEYYD